MNNHVCYANWLLSAGLSRIIFRNYNSYLLGANQLSYLPSPSQGGLHLLQQPQCLMDLCVLIERAVI